jgi:hypothetical protein
MLILFYLQIRDNVMEGKAAATFSILLQRLFHLVKYKSV